MSYTLESNSAESVEKRFIKTDNFKKDGGVESEKERERRERLYKTAIINKNGFCMWSVRNLMCDRGSDSKGYTLYNRSVKCSESFIKDLESFIGRSIPASDDVYCQYGNGVVANAYALYNCHDLNQFANAHFVSKNYDKVYNAKWGVGTKMRGRTQCGRHGFAFPVTCTRREFINFLECMLDVTREERMSLFKDGIILSERVAMLYARVFPKGNLATPYAGDSLDVFEGLSILSTIILVLDAISKKDYRQLAFLCVSHIKVIGPVAEYLGVHVADFKDYIVSFMHSDEPEIQGEEETIYTWVKLLPGVVKQSPLVQKVIALATFMLSATFVTDSKIWKYLMNIIGPDFSEVKSKVLGAALFGQVCWALWCGIKRMQDFKDFEGLLGLSKDGAFIESVNEIKLTREGAMSDAEAKKLVERIDSLLASRKGLTDSAQISRMCDYLISKKKEVMCFMDDYKPREKPILIWLNGAPGSGKTTLIEGLKNFLAIKDGVERKKGDTVIYDIHDKYPAEMSKCHDSRYCEINDIPDDYSGYDKLGYVPLDVLLQQMIDTSPLTFQSAFEKGVMYNNIRYVFITSNHFNYKMSGDVGKLQRRLDDSIIFDVSFKGSKSYGTIAALGSKVRNDHLLFRVLKANCGKDRIVSFKDTDLALNYNHFIPYLEERINSLQEDRRVEHDMFNTVKCSCGLARANHLYKLAYITLSDRCDLALLKDDEHDFDGSLLPKNKRNEVVSLEPEEELKEYETVPLEYDPEDLDEVVLLDPEEEMVEHEHESPQRDMAEWNSYVRPFALALASYVPNLFTLRDMVQGDDHLCSVLLTRLENGCRLYEEVLPPHVPIVLRILHALHTFDPAFTFELPRKVGNIEMVDDEDADISDVYYSFSATNRVLRKDVEVACTAIVVLSGGVPPRSINDGLIAVHEGLLSNSINPTGAVAGHLKVIRDAGVLPPDTHAILLEKVEPQSVYIFFGWLGMVITLFRHAPTLSTFQMCALWFKLNVYFVCFSFFCGIMHGVLTLRYGNSYIVREYVLRTKLTNAVLRIQKFIFEHRKTMAFIGISSIMGYALMQEKKTQVEVRGVTRLNYDATSMTTSVVRTEQRMATNNRPWAQTGPIRMIQLKTSNVNSGDLRSKVANAVIPSHFAPFAKLTLGYSSGFIFVLSSSVIVVNKHYLVSEDDNGIKQLRDTIVKLGDGREIILRKDDFAEVPGSEAILVNCSDFPTHDNLSKFLPKNLPPGTSFDGVYAPTGERVVVKGENISLKDGFGDYPALSCKLVTDKGDCGNILIGEVNNNSFIAGMLFAGKPGAEHITYFTPIGAQEHASCRIVIPEPSDIQPLDPGSEINNDPHEEMLPVGTNPKEGRQGFRTAFKETRLYPYLKDKLSEPFYYPTKIAGNVSTEPSVYVHGSAWRTTFAKFDLVNMCSHSMLGLCTLEYVSAFPEEGPLAPLTLEQAFFGAPEIGVEGFPMKTSAGPFWRKMGYKKKEDLFIENPDTGCYEILPLFRDAVQKGLNMLDEGVVVAPHVELAAKDEIRPVRKLREYKVRLFSVVDADYNVLIRMYVMPLVAYLLKHKYVSECFGQMHAASKQWTDLKNYLTGTGFSKFADMDFSSFDTCHDSRIFRAVSNVMLLVALRVGYSESDALKVKYLVESMSVQMCQYKGDYFVKTKGMPSGVILTLIMNSIANSLLMRVVFSTLTQKPVSEFRKYVRLATVGDDNIHSFSDEIAGIFTMSKAEPIYKQLGYTITPASKEGDFVDWMSLEELTFVKRRFVLWEDGFYRAPLDRDSIYKAFCFETKRSPEGSIERLRSVYTSGIYEAYLHGREFFDSFVEEMSSLYHEHELVFDSITFEELNDKFLSTGIMTQFA